VLDRIADRALLCDFHDGSVGMPDLDGSEFGSLGRRVVAPGFLENTQVRRWLNGIQPAWSMLEYDSFRALHEEPSAGNRTIRLEPNLTDTDLSGSAVARTANILLQRASETGGLKLTATGNLSRGVVGQMIEVIEWPGLDRDELFALNKVINEPDFLPAHFVRVLLQGTKLVRTQRGMLVPTRLGKQMLVPERHGTLQALLFHVALWHLNLGYFDRNPVGSWPQTHTGVVLWSLSTAASDWLDRVTLTRLCTVPIPSVLDSAWDLGTYAMDARILKPLVWFGLLDSRREGRTESTERRLYRKTALFDWFLKFTVQIERPATRH
jgi:hypothetical protein